MHNLLHWRLLVAVADSGTITQAAALCGMTQSAASGPSLNWRQC